jgi:TfoX/Sxy family transcriptional regulator of competence genes
MAINIQLTEKVRKALSNISGVEEKKMFSGIAFMVNEKLCITVGNNRIMCRVDPALHDELVEQPGCTSMIMKGREYKGYVVVDEAVLQTKKQLDYWVKLALDFNPKAKVAAKRTSKKSQK